MANAQDLKLKLDSLFPGAVHDMLEKLPGQVSVRCTKETSEETKAAIQAVIDGFDWNALPPDLTGFNSLFLQGYIEGVFSQSQLIDAELAQKITDEQYRNAWLRGLIGNGSPEQQKRLFEIAEACNIPLPK